MLQADYNRGTKDGDVLESAPINQAIKTELLGLGGKGTALAKRHDLYLDIVAGGILFLPAATIYLTFRTSRSHFSRIRSAAASPVCSQSRMIWSSFRPLAIHSR
jgi:energy-converting hydrogenase Eha subunit C